MSDGSWVRELGRLLSRLDTERRPWDEARRSSPGFLAAAHAVEDHGVKPRHRILAARRVLAERDRLRQAERVSAAFAALSRPVHRLHLGADNRRRKALVEVELAGVRVRLHGRPLPEAWQVEVAAVAGAVRACCGAWGAVASPGLALASWRPLRCGLVICPMCSHARRARRSEALAAALEPVVATGRYAVLHWTSTQPTRPGGGAVALGEGEALELADPQRRAEPGELAHAVGDGEPLGEAWQRLAASLRAWTQRRGEVGGAVVAEIRGLEATQRAPTRRGCPATLRWHVHAHRLLIVRVEALQDAEIEGEIVAGRTRWTLTGGAWRAAALARWREVSEGATDEAQRIRVIAVPGRVEVEAGRLRAALRQTIKYSGELSTMTQAGVVEFLSAVKGLRPVRLAGVLDGAAGAGALARGIALLDAEAEVEAAEAAEAEWVKAGSAEDAVAARARLEALAERRGRPACEARAVALGELAGRLDAPAEVAEAWAGAVRSLLLRPAREGEVGLVVVRHRRGVRVLTRARLAVWSRHGRRLEVAVLPDPGRLLSDAEAYDAVQAAGDLAWRWVGSRELAAAWGMLRARRGGRILAATLGRRAGGAL